MTYPDNYFGCYTMLCYAMLCYAVLYVMLCYDMLWYDMICYNMLWYEMSRDERRWVGMSGDERRWAEMSELCSCELVFLWTLFSFLLLHVRICFAFPPVDRRLKGFRAFGFGVAFCARVLCIGNGCSSFRSCTVHWQCRLSCARCDVQCVFLCHPVCLWSGTTPTPSTNYLNLQDLRNLRFKQFVKGKASVPACSCVQSCLACVLRGAGICLFLIKVLKNVGQ
jgi:hypothetical protein